MTFDIKNLTARRLLLTPCANKTPSASGIYRAHCMHSEHIQRQGSKYYFYSFIIILGFLHAKWIRSANELVRIKEPLWSEPFPNLSKDERGRSDASHPPVPENGAPMPTLLLKSPAEMCRQLMLPNVLWPQVRPRGSSFTRLQNQIPLTHN